MSPVCPRPFSVFGLGASLTSAMALSFVIEESRAGPDTWDDGCSPPPWGLMPSLDGPSSSRGRCLVPSLSSPSRRGPSGIRASRRGIQRAHRLGRPVAPPSRVAARARGLGHASFARSADRRGSSAPHGPGRSVGPAAWCRTGIGTIRVNGPSGRGGVRPLARRRPRGRGYRSRIVARREDVEWLAGPSSSSGNMPRSPGSPRGMDSSWTLGCGSRYRGGGIIRPER